MFKKLILITAVMALCSWDAFAALSIQVDLDKDISTWETGTFATGNAGDTLTMDIYAVDLPVDDGLAGYGFVLNWTNPQAVQWVSPTDLTNAAKTPWSDFFDSSHGTQGDLHIMGMAPIGTSISGTSLLATLEFNVVDAKKESVFTMKDWDSYGGWWITGRGNDLAPNFFGREVIIDPLVTVNPVPIPAGIWLLGSGLLGLLGLRRRN